MSSNAPFVAAVLGATGSGKSLYVKRLIARREHARRILIWDPMREYAGFGDVLTGAGQLLDVLTAAGNLGKFRAVFQPIAEQRQRQRQFEFVCAAALAAGSLSLVVEELRFVTTPSRAPASWAAVCLQGRHSRLRVIATSQRPASVDKDFFGNCTLIHTGRLVYAADVRAVARAMLLDESSIAGLAPLEWIERDMLTGETRAGSVST